MFAKVLKLLWLLAAAFLLLAAFYFFKHQNGSLILENADLLIVNGRVLTMNANDQVIENGWLAVKNSTIYQLGQGSPPKNLLAKKTIDARGGIVMPGLVNAHAHAAMSLLDGLVNNQSLRDWLTSAESYESNLSADDVYWGTLLAETKMITTGTTVFNDMYLFERSTAKAAEDSGIRAVVRVPISIKNGSLVFDEDFINHNRDNSLISMSLAPNPILNYSLPQLRQIAYYAKINNFLIHIHFDEDSQSRLDYMTRFNMGPADFLKNVGFLGNKIVLAHAGDLNQDEIEQLAADADLSVAFCPISEKNLQTPPSPAFKMLSKQIPLALGSDGEPSGNLDMFLQMHSAAQVGNLSPKDAVKMATVWGAKALGLNDKIGQLKPGMQADIIVLKPKDLSQDIYTSLVYNTDGQEVIHTIVGGKILMENKKLLTINQAEVLANASQISLRLEAEK